MKHLAIPAALVAAFLATGCAETVEVCNTYGNRTTCYTENAAKQRRINQRAIRDYLDNALVKEQR